MEKRIPMFEILEIETSSYCERRCKTCLRNSHKNRELVSPYFVQTLLPSNTITKILVQAQEMGFKGMVCLGHHNEPLLDPRIFTIAKQVANMGFQHVFACVNEHYLTPENIARADNSFQGFHVSDYRKDPEKRAERQRELRAAFKKTALIFADPNHLTTHYSPKANLEESIRIRANNPCLPITKRMIVNFQGKMFVCCDDYGAWDMGTIYENSVEELWYSEKHQDMVERLLKPGGRQSEEYCRICPRY